MINVCNMYPQYQTIPDRRTQTNNVAVDRRSGVDRRGVNRVKLDNNLTRDIFVLRSSVAEANKNNNSASDSSNKISFTQKLQKALESISNNKDNRDIYSTNSEKNNTQAIKSDNTSSVGMLVGGLAAVMGGLALGIGGLFTGIGAAVYTSTKSIKHVIGSLFK